MKRFIQLLSGIFAGTALFFSVLIHAQSFNKQLVNITADGTILTGFRASRILSNYPDTTFPFASYWISVGERMSRRFLNSVPAAIWIVSLYDGNGNTQLNFKAPNYPHILSEEEDFNEAYLDSFDNTAIRVFLQVEPGQANTDTLINLVLRKYSHHSCIAGFGVDAEYNRNSDNPASPNFSGTRIQNSEAQRWEALVKSYNSGYRLFLKHFLIQNMPSTFRGDIIFVDDSQEFSSLTEMQNEFKTWGNAFSANDVWFQYGYESDQNWWSRLNDPSKEIGDALLSSIPNTRGLFWVDFTVTRVFSTTVKKIDAVPSGFKVYQNYPNPFNPETTIKWEMPEDGDVAIKIYDITGREAATLLDKYLLPGVYQFNYNASPLPSGVYLYTIELKSPLRTYNAAKKFLLIK